MQRHRQAALSAAVLVAVGAFLLVIRGPWLGSGAERAVDDLGQMIAALVGAVAGGVRGRSRAGRRWLWLGAGCLSWALGEAVWSYYELVARQATPFPSLADAGYLGFPVLAGIGLLRWPAGWTRAARWRSLLDGVLIAGALLITSWATALGVTWRQGADSRFAFVVALAYPVTDVVLLTLTLLIVSRTRAVASGIETVAAAMASLCIADSGFAYLTAIGRYATGSPVDAGWFGGFLLVAVAAQAPGAGAGTVDGSGTGDDERTARLVIPYVPAVVGIGVATWRELAGRVEPFVVVASCLVIAVLLGRQLLALHDNRRLVGKLVAAHDELSYMAFHDPLTGLANRALLADRLRHGLELHRRDLRPITLVYCDLDGFKAVNDDLGHDVGDAVLTAFAERLLAVTDPGDTVARMGGDEFAVVVEDGTDPADLAARLLAALTQPATVLRRSIDLRSSIGIAHLPPGARSVDHDELLQRADAAMYRAKREGAHGVAFWEEPDPASRSEDATVA